MKKTSKKKILYKIISLTTIIAPTLVFLLIHALYYSIDYDIWFHNLVIEEVQIGYNIDLPYVYSEVEYTEVSGTVSLQDGYMVSYINDTTIIRVGNQYYSYNFETNNFVDIKALEFQKQQETKLPLWFIVALVSLGIGFLVIKGNMKHAMRTPRLSAFVGLAILTAITYFISLIATNMFNVFFVMTISWGLYCVEYLIYTNANKDEALKDKSNLLLNAVNDALKNFK